MTLATVDLLVIGAGPAGMACAIQASTLGLKVLVIDENPLPGGQIFRNVSQSPLKNATLLGEDYGSGAALVREFLASSASYWPDTIAWQITKTLQVSFTRRGDVAASGQIQTKALVISNGAYERPFPVPGWTLPGVMSVGAAQTLVKSAGLFPDTTTVLAGSGPLLYLFAWQLIQANRPPAAILETTPRKNFWRALKHFQGAVSNPAYLAKGMGLLRAIKNARVKHIRNVDSLSIAGSGKAEQVRYTSRGKTGEISASVVLLHHGVVPNVQLTRSMGCEHDWDENQLCWRARIDHSGETSVPNVFLAGDGAGIGGAISAQIFGKMVAFTIAGRVGALDADAVTRKLQITGRRLREHSRIRPFLDALYRPSERFRRPSDETIVCRCEEVSAGQIRKMARLGCTGPNQTKSFSRCGMGPCQGRLCGLTVSELLAEENQCTIEEIGYYNVRPPIKPISLGELAVSFIPDENAVKPTEWIPK